MTKIKKIISFEKLDLEVKEAILRKYPDGWKNHIQKFSKGNGAFFHAIAIDHGDFSYLVKINVKIDSLSDLEKDEDKDDFDEMPDDEVDMEFDDDKDYNSDSNKD